MTFVIENDGTMRCLYTEVVDLNALGALSVKRASFIEYFEDEWSVDLADGRHLGTFRSRSDALDAEITSLEAEMAHG